MTCYFCKRDEKEIEAVFASVIENLEKQLRELVNEKNNIRGIIAQKYGFVQENFDKVKAIKPWVLNLKINVLEENATAMFEGEPNLELLHSYLKTYRPKIPQGATLSDLAGLYVKEPNSKMIQSAEEELLPRKNYITKMYNAIQKNCTLLEAEIEYEMPIGIFSLEQGLMFDIVKQIKSSENSRKNELPKKVLLCPFCRYLFDVSAKVIQDEKNVFESDGHVDWVERDKKLNTDIESKKEYDNGYGVYTK
jgi:hypothetical protein